MLIFASRRSLPNVAIALVNFNRLGFIMSEQRTTPILENPEEIKQKLQAWLAQSVLPKANITITSFEIPETTGMSNITVLFDLEVKENNNSELLPLVARIQAHGQKLAFPTYDLPMQVDIMNALQKVDGINVPSVMAQEDSGEVLGVPFYIMHKNDGLIPPDIPPYHMDGWIVESSPKEREQLWFSCTDMMAKLHILNIDDEPLASFIANNSFPKNLDEQLSYWENYEQWGLEGTENKHCTKALQWLRKHQPSVDNLRFCWGDSRMANVIFTNDKSEVAALLDWEMLALGDPVQDLAWWIFMDELFSLGLGVPRLEGFPSRDETVAFWCEKTGFSADNLHYYLVFAGMRISLILARMSLAKGDNGMLEESFASVYMDQLLDAPF